MAIFSERKKIYKEPQLRPYASRVGIILNDADEFRIGEGASLLLNEDHIITFLPYFNKIGNIEAQQIRASVEGFSTAGEAESAGLKLSAAILWLAVSMNCPLRLDYHTPLPCVVYDRTQNGDLHLSCSAHATRISNPNKVVRLLQQIYCREEPIHSTLLMSMELFVSARLEVTKRTRFLGLVSALEPIAKQKDYGEPVRNLSTQFIDLLAKDSSIPQAIRPSLIGRIRDLNRESVMQAIYRLIADNFPCNQTTLNTVKKAYSVRSSIVHDGSSDVDLDELSNEIEQVIRRIYSRMLNLELATSVDG